MTSSIQLPNPTSSTIGSIIQCSSGAVSGALAARFVKNITTAGGAIFGAVASATYLTLTEVEEKLKIDTLVSKIVFMAAKILASIGAGYATVNYLGHGLSFSQAHNLYTCTSVIQCIGFLAIATVGVLGTIAIGAMSTYNREVA
jgi:hypothetical protein